MENKPKIKYIRGNLFDTNRIVIAHSCNCLGAFGSGVAGQIAKLYPDARKAYLEKFKDPGWKLGDVQIVEIPAHNLKNKNEKRIIANMATQRTFGTTGKHVSYPACFECFDKLFRFCEAEDLDVAMPKVG